MAFVACAKRLVPALHRIPKSRCIQINPVRNIVSKQLVYTRFGDPLEVIKCREARVPVLGPQDVLVRMLAAPVNPADINTIQGKYPVKIELPCIPGNEGVGIIEEVGSDVSELNPGQKVIMIGNGVGTWRDFGVFKINSLYAVPNELGNVEAATLSVNPCTAYRMLHDFVSVKINDKIVVIQNGANSACGQSVIQLCAAWNIQTVNIIRDRPNVIELKKYLHSLGGTHVLTEEELRSTQIFKGTIDKPSLALNCVGGKSSLEMLRYLQHGGKMITYGGMSRQPVSVPTSAFIFKDISLHGFWMSRWKDVADKKSIQSMMDELISLMCKGKLKGAAHKMIKFTDYAEALQNTLNPTGFLGYKYILDFTG